MDIFNHLMQGFGVDAAERELPVLGGAGLLGGGAQHAPHAGHLVTALERKRLVVKRGIGRVARGHGGVVELCKGGVEALQFLGVWVHEGVRQR